MSMKQSYDRVSELRRQVVDSIENGQPGCALAALEEMRRHLVQLGSILYANDDLYDGAKAKALYGGDSAEQNAADYKLATRRKQGWT
jgi:hypothetical protein